MDMEATCSCKLWDEDNTLDSDDDHVASFVV